MDEKQILGMSKKQILGLVGSIILILGVFMPLISMPIMGSLNYIQNGKGDGLFILLLAVVSLILVVLKKYKGLWFTGFGSLAIMAYTFINLQIWISESQRELAGNLFAGLATVQLQWGWAVLTIGAVLIIASAAIKEEGS